MAHCRVRVETPRRVPVRRPAVTECARIGVTVLLSITAACRTNDAREPSDTARIPTSEAPPAAAPAIRDSSAGSVAMATPRMDTAGAGRHDTAGRSTKSPMPPQAVPAPNVRRPADSVSHSVRRARDTSAPTSARATEPPRDSVASTARPATPMTRDSSAARDSARATRDTVQPSREAQQPANAQAPGGPAGDKLAVTQSEYNGWKVFAVNCTRCHGEDAVGSTIAPSLIKSLREHVTHEVFVQTVKNGRPDKGMPTWGPLLSDTQIEDLYAYLKARSDARLAPGRPHVKTGN
jgi:mono/diheme cytochrome c family protein